MLGRIELIAVICSHGRLSQESWSTLNCFFQIGCFLPSFLCQSVFIFVLMCFRFNSEEPPWCWRLGNIRKLHLRVLICRLRLNVDVDNLVFLLLSRHIISFLILDILRYQHYFHLRWRFAARCVWWRLNPLLLRWWLFAWWIDGWHNDWGVIDA